MLAFCHQILVREQISSSCRLACILNDAVNNLDLVLSKSFLPECLFDLKHLFIVLIPQREEHADSELLKLANCPIVNDTFEQLFVVSLLVLLSTYDVLLELGYVIEVPTVNDLPQLFKDVEMLGGVSFRFLELGEVLDDALHVLYGLELRLTLLVLKELLHEVVNVLGHLAEILVHYLLVEGVFVRREHDLFHVFL